MVILIGKIISMGDENVHHWILHSNQGRRASDKIDSEPNWKGLGANQAHS